LAQQINEQYQIILRQQALKNDELNEARCQAYSDEITRRLKNIDEIQRKFLQHCQLADKGYCPVFVFFA
jgi:hypothetical protein